MPQPRSAQLTTRYRDGLGRLRERAETAAERAWRALETDELDATYPRWLDTVVPFLGAAQGAAVTLTETYLAAFVSAETGRPHDVAIDPEPFVELDAFGRPLRETLTPPLLSIKQAIGSGDPVAIAVEKGRHRAMQLVGEAVVEAGRLAQFAAMQEDPNIVGWRRVPRGTCGACLADTRTYVREPGEPMRRHPNCLCVAEPGVRGVVDRNPRPSGAELFAQMSQEAKVAQFGPAKAEALRAGEIALSDLAHEHELALGGSLLTEATLAQATR